jgi:hypothetical protein
MIEQKRAYPPQGTAIKDFSDRLSAKFGMGIHLFRRRIGSGGLGEELMILETYLLPVIST